MACLNVCFHPVTGGNSPHVYSAYLRLAHLTLCYPRAVVLAGFIHMLTTMWHVVILLAVRVRHRCFADRLWFSYASAFCLPCLHEPLFASRNPSLPPHLNNSRFSSVLGKRFWAWVRPALSQVCQVQPTSVSDSFLAALALVYI